MYKRNYLFLKIIIFIVLLNFSLFCFADTIYLRSGSVIKGKIISQDEDTVTIKASLGEMKIKMKDIKSIEYDEKDVIVHLKDGTILKGKILRRDEQKIDIETGLGKLSIGREKILKIELISVKDKILADKGKIAKEKEKKPPTKPEYEKVLQKANATSSISAQRKKKLEISLMGSFMMPSGAMNAEDVASDLYSGRWSPWFGKGYTDFNWSGGIKDMDDVIGDAVVNSKSGILAGIKLGYNITPMFQIEFMYNYGFSGFKFDDAAWNTINDVREKTIEILDKNNPQFEDMSVQSAGKTNIFGLNLNINLINIIPEGPFIPYFSLGVGVVNISNTPIIFYDLTQSTWLGSSAYYTLNVTYETKSYIAFSAGIGGKLALSESFGLKLEIRGAFAKLSLGQNLVTTFKRESSVWRMYYDYNDKAITQTGFSVIMSGGLGLYFAF